MDRTTIPESGTRNRTRRAILSAAATVLARDRTATLADIADAAEVGRSTLHRYFPDRDELIRAVVEDSYRTLQEAIDGAAVDQGPPLEAMRRLVAAMVGAGDRILFLYGDPRVLEGFHGAEASSAAGQPMLELIKRGQADGVFDPRVGADWIQNVLWALVYSGCDAAGKGVLPRHGVAWTVTRTFENGVHVRGERQP